MKKRILCLLLCMLLTMTMISCGGDEPKVSEPASAQELYEKIDEQMDALNSYRTDMNMKMTFYFNGIKVTGEGTGYAVENVNLEGDYYFYTETTTKITTNDLSLNQTQKNIEGYYKGNYFISDEQNGKAQKLYSAMTAEEAKEYRLDSELNTIDLIKDCATKEFSKKEDGTWELNCSGYTKTAIDKISRQMGLDDSALSVDVMDLKLVVLADANYRATQIKIDFMFEEAKNAPAVSMTANYSQYNETCTPSASLNTEDYTKVDDIRVLDTIEDLLKERNESDSCKFTLDLKQLIRTSEGKQLSVYTEENSISFGEGDNGYFYDIDAYINKASYDISYKNGKQIVKTGSQTQNNAQTEQEAREWIKSLINAAKYAPGIVTNVEDKGDGVYKLTCGSLNTDEYETFFASSNGKMNSVSQSITVTIKDGAIISILSTVTAKGTVATYGSITLTVTTTVKFQ